MPVAACISLCFPEDGNYVILVFFIVSFQIPKAHPEGHASRLPVLRLVSNQVVQDGLVPVVDPQRIEEHLRRYIIVDAGLANIEGVLVIHCEFDRRPPSRSDRIFAVSSEKYSFPVACTVALNLLLN